MDDLILKYLNNTITDEEIITLYEWAKKSPENMAQLQQMDTLNNMSIIAQCHTKHRPGRINLLWNRRILRWVASAAAIVLIGLFSGHLISEYKISKFTAQQVTFFSPRGQRSILKLADGTHVWLNAGSSLKYPLLFAKNERRVFLSGEAMFDVTPDKNCPFYVETRNCTSKVLGTKFNILADEQLNIFVAALLEGKLQVFCKQTSDSLTLAPNQIARLKDGHLIYEPIEDHNDYRWTEGIINIRGLSFEEVIHKLELSYNVDIHIIKDAPTENVGIGKITVSSGIEHALNVLQCVWDFNYTIDQDKRIVTIK